MCTQGTSAIHLAEHARGPDAPGTGKVRSIVGQNILFDYTVRTIMQRLKDGGSTNVFSRRYAKQALETALARLSIARTMAKSSGARTMMGIRNT